MKTDFREIGNRIVERRKYLGYTQEILAEKSNISTTFIGNIERAASKCSIETLMKICNGLDVTPDYLLLGADKNIDSNILIELNTAFSRCGKKKQYFILNYIKWLLEQDITE